jgi:predicted Zn-dependent protease
MRTGLVVAMLLSRYLLPAQDTSSRNLEKEAALGRHLAEHFDSRVESDATIQTYLDRLSQQVGPQIKNADFPFTVKAISDDQCSITHEPVALPASYTLVPEALFLAAKDEAEFAGMLTQAMERIVLRQGLRTETKVDSLASVPLVFMGAGCSEGALVPVSQAKSAMEADGLAVEALAHAGFDPEGLSHYLERVSPDRPERVDNIRYVTKLQPQTSYIVDDSQFAAVKQRVRSLTEAPPHNRKMPSLQPQ